MATLLTTEQDVRDIRGQCVVVTGPTRGGTKIYAKIIADILGWQYVNEHEFGCSDFVRMAREFVGGHVYQAPAYLWGASFLDRPETATVFVHRNSEEIVKSRRRLWNDRGEPLDADRLGLDTAGHAVMKARLWAMLELHNMYDIEYGALADHPMWVTKEDREELGEAWTVNRTEVEV